MRSLYHSIRHRGQIVIFRGTRIRLDRGARIHLPRGSQLLLGKDYAAGTVTSLDLRNNASLTLQGQGRVSVARGVRLLVLTGAHLEIGAKTAINFDTAITCVNKLSIGRNCFISWNVNILDGNIHELAVASVPRPRSQPTSLGDHVWIGTGATVLGAEIGAGTVVGAGSVVTTNLPGEVLAAGNPARVIKKDVTWGC